MAQLTQKQIDFARAVVSGRYDSLADAYRHVYNCTNMRPKTVRTEASKLMQHQGITTMVERLRRQQEVETVDMVTSDRDRILKRLRQLLDAPEGTPAENVSLKAAQLLGSTLGLYQKKVEIDDKRQLSADELRQQIQERLADLGLDGSTHH